MTNRSKLILLRGPSGAGKSTIAKALQQLSDRPTALVEQDVYRQLIFRGQDEKRKTRPARHEMIKASVDIALTHGFDVIVEGFFYYPAYQSMVEAWLARDDVDAYPFYFDISLEETHRRHQTRPKASEFSTEEMTSWYNLVRPLDVEGEIIITESMTTDETIDIICKTVGLSSSAVGE